MPSTVPYDHPSQHNTQTPLSRRHKSNTTGEITSRQPLKIAHQKVDIDVDLANQLIRGETEITVLPLEQNLKQLKLDCRNIQVEEVFVNNKRASFRYDDFNRNDEYFNNIENYTVRNITSKQSQGKEAEFNPQYDLKSKHFDVHQHHLYKGKYHPTYGNTNHLDELNLNSDQQLAQQTYHHPYTPLLLTNTEELVIQFPEGLRLRLQNNVQHFSPSKSSHNTPFSSANTLLNQEQVYTPVIVKIKYTVRNPKNGLLFNGGLQTRVPKDQWYCYTVNNDMNFSASCWIPCVDNNYEKNTWDVNISVPKTIGDIGDSKIIGTKAADTAMKKQQRKDDDDYDEDDDAEESDIDTKREIVIASPELLNYTEIPHTTDFSKKIFSIQVYNPVAAQHVGFAIGPFEKLPLVGFNDEVKDPETDLNNSASPVTNVPIMIYFLPGKKNEAVNTCIFMHKAMDFYSKEFGSFPFNSYCVVFLNELFSTSCGFAGLSMVSDSLLYGANKIEPIFSSTEALSKIMAQQWSGVNVIPKTHNDIWCVIGLAEFMASQFIKKLFGLNEFKYRNKLKADLVCEQDIRKRPLANQFFRFPINDASDFEFLKLKASLVMIILDRRMTKTDKSFGLSRVIPKIFLQAMSNDLFNGNCLSTYHFKHVCEKVNHNRLDNFFRNWVYSSGTPVLRISQKFNKKRMVIELNVRQVQVQELNTRNENGMLNSGLSSESRHADDNFVDDAINFIENDDSEFNVPAIFQGPMTIRVHEADGTPYEHIVELKDGVSKLDIPYNTKYRRLKRGKKKQVEFANDEAPEDTKLAKDQLEDVKINCLGDVLQSSEEIKSWNLQDWSKEDEENQNNESFEWLRVDADFEWICKVHFNQPDYMYYSQLQQDRDVEAQIDSVRFFSNPIKARSLYSSILTRTLMDNRYFYGVRLEAAIGLAKLAKEEVSFIGMRHLLKSFHSLYCFASSYNVMAPVNENNYLPLPNNFEDFGSFFILKVIPKALASIKLPSGEVPLEIRKLLLNLLKFNDNLNNKFDDSNYVVDIIEALFASICNSGGFLVDHANDKELDAFMAETDIELERLLKLDQFLPSLHTITESILKQRIKAARMGFYKMSFKELLSYTLPSTTLGVKVAAFEGLLTLGGLKNSDVVHYFFTICKLDDSQRLKAQLIGVLLHAISIAAIHGTPSLVDDPEYDEAYSESTDTRQDTDGNKDSRVVFIEEASSKTSMNSRRDAFARATISGAINILRRDYSFGRGLKNEIWIALHSNLLSIYAKRCLFDVCDILYEPRNSFIVTIDNANDKKIFAKVGKVNISEFDVRSTVYEVVFQRKGRIKIHIPKNSDKKKEKRPTPKIKLETTAITPFSKIKISKPNNDINGNGAAERSAELKSRDGDTEVISNGAVQKKPSKIVSFKFLSPESHQRFRSLSASLDLSASHFEIKRSSADLPLRYVKISPRRALKLVLSTDPIAETKSSDENRIVTLEKDLYGLNPSLKIKIHLDKLTHTSVESAVKSEDFPDEPDLGAVPGFETEATSKPNALAHDTRNADESTFLNGASVSSLKTESVPSIPPPDATPSARPEIKLKIRFNTSKKESL